MSKNIFKEAIEYLNTDEWKYFYRYGSDFIKENFSIKTFALIK